MLELSAVEKWYFETNPFKEYNVLWLSATNSTLDGTTVS